MSRLSLLIVAAAVLCLAFGCADEPVNSPEKPGPQELQQDAEPALWTIFKGTVTDGNGAPLEGASVFIRYCDGDQGEHSLEDITDATGSFVIKGVPEGAWTVIAALMHYQRFEDEVVFPSNGVVNLNITLTANGGPHTMEPPDGGESAGNNLSFPVVWSDGYALAMRGVYGAPVFDGQYHLLPDDPDSTKWYLQQDEFNEWQAGSLDATGAPFYVDYIDWGDNLESRNWHERSIVRTEVVLYQDLTVPLVGFTMSYLFGEGPSEMQGTNTVTYDSYQATVYSRCARLTIQKLTDDWSDEMLVWDPAIGEWTGEGIEGTYYNSGVWEGGGEGPDAGYTAETNVSGKVIYGYNWNLRDTGNGDGFYRLTFSLDGLNSDWPLNTYFDEFTTIPPPGEGEEGGEGGGGATYVRPDLNLTYIDVYIEPRGGGPGGGGRNDGQQGGGGGGGGGHGW